ncbi:MULTISPECIES: WD40 repeat domain-containing protein [Nostocales]|uniref:WD40 repeat domain-containing protein n=1 Tax=Nostocales TaxID=1161 RepID=UPI00168254E7|nr:MULTISPECIES: WD40 repeat domain-containing protein [Nostocales]MBD2303707.1 WD40 repeat domain-containing protein [Nostoc sp. FACHB-190]MBD2491819.1 WD40 repeat domain-containing protein [Aulosira sp. FACHB-615]MBD2496554.1 WD40 repeat domain-containing protein [Nostoc sp. FACHB-280]
MDCKALIYDAVRKQAIAPIYPHSLVKWDISQQPRIIEQIELPYDFESVPSIVLLPDGERFAVAPSEVTPEFGIEILRWDDLSVLQRVDLPHAPYEENSQEDEYYGHGKCTHISWLGLTPCQGYLLVGEGWGDIYLVNLESGEQIRWLRRWRDYNAAFAIDPQMQFLIVNSVDMDESHQFYRIDSMLEDKLTYLGEYSGGVRCHRGNLSFSPDGQRLAYTAYRYQGVDLLSFQLERSILSTLSPQTQEPLNEIWKKWEKSSQYREKMWGQFFRLYHDHDGLNPWQSNIVWLGNNRLLCGVGQILAVLSAQTGEIIKTYDVDAVVNTLVFDYTSFQAIVATKQGIKVVAIA